MAQCCLLEARLGTTVKGDSSAAVLPVEGSTCRSSKYTFQIWPRGTLTFELKAKLCYTTCYYYSPGCTYAIVSGSRNFLKDYLSLLAKCFSSLNCSTLFGDSLGFLVFLSTSGYFACLISQNRQL